MVRSLRQSIVWQCQPNLLPLHGVTPSRNAPPISQPTRKLQGQEAASTQAVHRGHKVEMSEVMDQDDDTSFMMNMKSKLTSPIDIENCGDLTNGSRALMGRCDG